MDQVKLVLQQKFWILLGIGIILPFVGWYMYSSARAAEIKNRKAVLDGLEKKLAVNSPPSKDFADKLKIENGKQAEQVVEASRWLWENQYRAMKWPGVVLPYIQKAGYLGRIDSIGLEQYRESYPTEVARVLEVARPLDPVTGNGFLLMPDETSMGFVKWSVVWNDRSPDSSEVWDAQEDMWLLEALFARLAAINGGDQIQSRLDMVVHTVRTLFLLGGNRKDGKPIGGGGPSSSGSSGGGGFAGGGGGMFSPPGGHGGGGGGGGGLMPKTSSGGADFAPSEEFGDPPSVTVQTPAGQPQVGPPRQMLRRYVEDEQNMPFKTRGFYLVAIMDHRKIPDLLAELTSDNSPWPIEILRVQFVRMNDDPIEGNGPGSGGGGASGLAVGAGFAGGSPGFGGGSGFSSGGGSSFSPPGAHGGGPGPGGGSFSGGPGFSPPGAHGGGGAPGAGMRSGGPDAEGSLGFGGVRTSLPGDLKNAAAFQALKAAYEDPNMAEVAICGLITLYKPPKDWKPEMLIPATPVAPINSGDLSGTAVEPSVDPAVDEASADEGATTPASESTEDDTADAAPEAASAATASGTKVDGAESSPTDESAMDAEPTDAAAAAAKKEPVGSGSN